VINCIKVILRRFLNKAGRKLRENDGSAYMNLMWLMFAIMLMVAVYIEYNRINHILKTVDMAYERALTAVAVNNYDEIYENVREEEAYGGAFNGGNEGEYEEDEKPVFFDDSDYGDIEDELVSLLGLTKLSDSDVISKISSGSVNEFSLSDFHAEITQDGTDIDGKYRVDGKLKVRVPIYFMGKELTALDLEVKSKATWRTRW
jgi:hypothetical protein